MNPIQAIAIVFLLAFFAFGAFICVIGHLESLFD